MPASLPVPKDLPLTRASQRLVEQVHAQGIDALEVAVVVLRALSLRCRDGTTASVDVDELAEALVAAWPSRAAGVRYAAFVARVDARSHRLAVEAGEARDSAAIDDQNVMPSRA